MRGVRAGLAAIVVAFMVLPAPASASRRALVLLDPPAPGSKATPHASAAAVLARNGLRRARPDVPQVGVMTVEIPGGTSFRRLATGLRRDPAVRSVERDSRHELRFLPSDPAVSEQD